MPTLRDLGEFGFIERIARLTGAASPEVLRAIGDDCAVLDVGAPDKLLVTTDAALEGRHFDLAWMSPYEAGQRTTAGALSDIAAMGGRPFACFCTAAIASDTDADAALDLLRGVAETGARYGAPLIGGDTISAFDRILLDVVVLGWAAEPWLRSGARPGDRLLLTGSLGESATALDLLLRDPALPSDPRFATLRRRMMDPTPRLQEAAALAPTGLVHAALDISDGLLQDAGHMARESTVRLTIHLASLPASSACLTAASELPPRPPWWPATSGEEYELLLAVDAQGANSLIALAAEQGLAPLTDIGEVGEGSGVVLLDSTGHPLPVARGGWDHFREPGK